MDDPLAELEAWWVDRGPDEEECDTLLLDYHEREDVTRLTFATVGGADTAYLERAEWRLEIADSEESVWRGGWGAEPCWSSEHVLLAPFQDPGAWVSFAKPLTDPLRAWGAVARTHRALAGDWISLGRFLRETMLDEPFGILANGPERFMAAYASALRAVGEDVASASPSHPPRPDEGPGPTVVTWGASYFVARTFRLVRMG